MNDRYPIPPDGEVLHAHHLKDQTLFTLRQAGRVLGGAWGFFRPADLEAAATANLIHLDDGEVVIENLALVSPGGLALRANKLRSRLTGESATMHLAWVLPESEAGTDREARVKLTLPANAAPTPGAPEEAQIGRVRAANPAEITLTAPALGLDATPELVHAWSALRDGFGELVTLFDQSTDCARLEWRTVRRALKHLDTVPASCGPIEAIRDVSYAFGQLADLASARADPKDAGEAAEGLYEQSKKCVHAAIEGTSRLCDQLWNLIEAVHAAKKTLAHWLVGRKKLKESCVRAEAGNMMVWSYSLPEVPPTSITITFTQDGDERVAAWIKFFDAQGQLLELEVEGNEGRAVASEVPHGAKRFELQCAEGVDVTVEE